MKLCLPTIGPNTAESAAQSRIAGFGGLNCHCFAHDRAPAGEELQVRHGATSGRGRAGGGRERSKSGRRGLVEERAH